MAAPAGKSFTKLAHEYTIAIPRDTIALPVYMSTWTRLKKQVSDCRRGVSFWATLFPTFIGILIPSIVPVYIDISDAARTGKVIITPWMLIFVLSLVSALLSLKAYRDSLRQESQSIQSILDEMEELQARYTREP